MARFTLPRDLYHGPHALEALKTLPGKRAMICVGGGSMKRFGFLDRAEAYLKEAGMEVELFEGIEPDPSVETVMKGAAAMEKPIGGYIADFYCAKTRLVIELDGAQHYTPEQQQTDSLRTEFFAQNHIRVLRFTNLDIDRHFDGVCQTIEAAVQAAV